MSKLCDIIEKWIKKNMVNDELIEENRRFEYSWWNLQFVYMSKPKSAQSLYLGIDTDAIQ
jgi:hypothetical protein